MRSAAPVLHPSRYCTCTYIPLPRNKRGVEIVIKGEVLDLQVFFSPYWRLSVFDQAQLFLAKSLIVLIFILGPLKTGGLDIFQFQNRGHFDPRGRK